jgi:hypothetical protein
VRSNELSFRDELKEEKIEEIETKENKNGRGKLLLVA